MIEELSEWSRIIGASGLFAIHGVESLVKKHHDHDEEIHPAADKQRDTQKVCVCVCVCSVYVCVFFLFLSLFISLSLCATCFPVRVTGAISGGELDLGALVS